MSTDIKLSKAQISKIILSGGFLGALLAKITGPLMKVVVPLSIMASASGMDGAIQRKMCGRGVVRAEKGITLVISNKDLDETIKIIKFRCINLAIMLELVKQWKT